MKREGGDTVLSAVFVDYDNIYMSLRRKSEEAAKQFAKDAPNWLRGIENGSLITPTNGVLGSAKRRIVMNRCYGNPVPRRNAHDNSTDMTSFPFIRHHFLRSGFEVVDCPPLTAQLKNSSDIRMVMDLRDYLTHPTYFDEFIILSGDADFTPVLHRLRQHARRTVIYANDHTAVPYTAICDGEVREADLIAMLLGGKDTVVEGTSPAALAAPSSNPQAPRQAPSAAAIRNEIIGEVVATVRASSTPVPLEALADRAVRSLGLEKTTGTGWAGAGSFRELLRQSLPAEIRLTDQPPYAAYDPRRHDLTPAPALVPVPIVVQAPAPAAIEPPRQQPMPALRQEATPIEQLYEPAPRFASPQPAQHAVHAAPAQVAAQAQPAARTHDAYRDEIPAVAKRAPGVEPTRPSMGASVTSRAPSQPVPQAQQATPDPMVAAQQMIARIYEACKAPRFAPAEYRAIFEMIAQEITENGIAGTQTLANIVTRAQGRGLDLHRDDARFVYDVVSEADPWFDQGASPNLFAGRFRNYVVQRCRDAGLALSAKELDLIDAWFAGPASATQAARQIPVQTPPLATPQPSSPSAPVAQRPSPSAYQPQPTAQHAAHADPQPVARWRTQDPDFVMVQQGQSAAPSAETDDDFPRIVRTRRV